MASIRRRKSSYRRRGRYTRRWRRGGFVTRALYNGSRRFVYQAKIRLPLTFNVASGSTVSQVIAASPWGIAPTSGDSWVIGPTNTTNYTRLLALFDENKCDWLQVRLMPSGNISSGPNMSVYLWVDRKFTSDELRYPSVAIASCPSAKEYRITGTSSRTCVKRVYARDLHEKITFHDCSTGATGDAAWAAGHDIGYMPGIMACLQLDSAPTAATSVAFNVEVTAQYTFRNMKFQ